MFDSSATYIIKVNLDRHSRQCAKWPVKSERLGIHFNGPWSIRTVKRVPSKYGCIILTDQTIARHSDCVTF